MADYIGSTTALLKYAVSSPASEFIVVTEPGIFHQMQKEAGHKTFIPAPPAANCACNECPFMKMNTLEKVYTALRDLPPASSYRRSSSSAPASRSNACSTCPRGTTDLDAARTERRDRASPLTGRGAWTPVPRRPPATGSRRYRREAGDTSTGGWGRPMGKRSRSPPCFGSSRGPPRGRRTPSVRPRRRR